MKKQVQFLTLFYAIFLSFGLTALGSPFQETSSPDSDGKKMSFQGTLYENGSPVTGERNFTFSIDLGDGNSWTETQSNVQIIEGLYAVTLGSVTPMPADLFYGVEGRSLTVSIGNTVLGSTQLLSPFSPKPIGPINDLPRRVEIGNTETSSDTIFYFKITADNITQGSQKGIQVDMTGQGFKTALRGNIKSQEGDATTKIAIIGSSTGAGNGTHEGVRGQAFGAGKNNSGVFGLAGGPGNGGTGFEGDGSYNSGVTGYGQSNSWGNVGVSGFAVGSVGVDNIGVSGISSVGDESNTEIENKGVLGRAEGLGINKAIWARAINGVENWAGWFEGDVAIRDGELKLSREDRPYARFWRNDQGAGSIQLKSSVDSVSVLIDSNGEKAGLIHLNDSLGRANFKMLTYAGGGSYLEQHAGIPDIGETRVTYQLVGNANPWTNMIARNADGTAKGRVQSGWLPGGGEEIGQFRISTGDNRTLAQLIGDGQNGGSISLEGPNSSNFWIGQKNWEDSNLAFMGMRGAYSVDDGNGGSYNPDLLSLETTRWEDGTELGQINFSKTTVEGVQTVSLNYDQVNNLVNQNSISLKGENGNEIAAFRRRGSNFGMAAFNNDNNELRAEIGSFGDNSGYMQLYGPNGSKNIQIGGSDGNRDLGMLRLSGTTENNLLNMEIQDINGVEERPLISLNSTAGARMTIESDAIRTYDPNNSSYNSTLSANSIGFNGENDFQTQYGLGFMQFNNNQGTSSSMNMTELSFFNNGNQVFGFNSNSGDLTISGTLNQSSDARLKKNVTTLTSGLATINKLRGVRYNWKDESKPENKIGFIAQEVEEVLPELVKTREDGFKGINYAEMSAVLVEAVKELNAKVAKLESENADLKAERGALKAEVEKVEALAERLAQIEALLNSANPNKIKK